MQTPYKKQINRGIVSGYDPETMTASVIPYSGAGIISDVTCPFSRYDPLNGAYAVTPPCVGSPCLYIEDGGEYIILATYPPPNLNVDAVSTTASPFNASISRAPVEMQNKGTLPGTPSATTSYGAEETFTDSVKRIIISPGKLSSVWNMLNCVWENFCSIFKFFSGGVDVTCDVDTANNTNTNIKVRRVVSEREATSVIELDMGKNADIILLKINGVNFLHVDADRNVQLDTKQIDLVATNINFSAEEFNCLNVGQVKLPK